MGRGLLVGVLALATAAAFGLLRLGNDGGMASGRAPAGAEKVPFEGVDSADEGARLLGVRKAAGEGTTGGEVAYAEADLPTLLAHLETRYAFHRRAIPPAAATRLLDLGRDDPAMLRHIVRVGLGLDRPEPPLWPPYFGGLLNTWDLRSVGILGDACVPALLEAWRESSEERHRSAVLGMIQKRLGPHAASLMPELAGVLRDASQPERLRWQVIYTARSFGREASEIGPDLLAWAKDADGPLHHVSLHALVDVVGLTPEVVDLYERVLLHGSIRERLDLIGDAFGSLQRLDVEPLRGVWVAMLRESEPLIQVEGIAALAGIGATTDEERRLLAVLAESPDVDVRRDAVEVLALRAGTEGRACLLGLAESTADYDVKWCAMRGLDKSGVPIVNRKDLVLSEFQDMDTLGVPIEVVSFLAGARQRPRVADYFAWMREQALDPTGPLHDHVPRMMGHLRGDDEAVVAFLLERAEAETARAGAWISSLAGYPSQAKRVVPWLERRAEAAAGVSERGAMAAIAVLARFALDRPDARRGLERLGRSEKRSVRDQAREYLESLEAEPSR